MHHYLIDTNVISEPTHSKPNPDVLGWLQSAALEQQWLCTITIAEIYKGIARNEDKKKRAFLQGWLQALLVEFSGRIISVDLDVARTLGNMLGKKQVALPPFDAIIAAIALTHGLTLVTRNIKDFRVPELKIFNPWEGA